MKTIIYQFVLAAFSLKVFFIITVKSLSSCTYIMVCFFCNDIVDQWRWQKCVNTLNPDPSCIKILSQGTTQEQFSFDFEEEEEKVV